MADPDDIAGAYVRCFSGPDGAAVLADLRRCTLGRALGPDASPALLRHLEGQRALVLRIVALAGRGRADPPATERTER